MFAFNCLRPGRARRLRHLTYADANLSRRCKHDRPSSKKLYQTLGVSEHCDEETLRLAFVHLAKRFHPDSGTPEASAVRFSEIESAYREIKKIRVAEKDLESAAKQAEEFDIKHTAPQHRHYLIHNVGTGTPSHRQRLYTAERAQKAVERVMEHRLKKLQAEERNTLVGMDKSRAKDIKTRYGMDRLVEDLIQEAMNKGEFSDLPGMGKPLKDNTSAQNPYVDFVTHKLNQVLIDNGFTPEWIQLSKEIREETQELRIRLTEARNRLGPCPLSTADKTAWKRATDKLQILAKEINRKIDKYNLLVPVLQKQMLHVKLEKLAEEIISVPPVEQNATNSVTTSNSTNNTGNINTNIFSLIGIFFRKKDT